MTPKQEKQCTFAANFNLFSVISVSVISRWFLVIGSQYISYQLSRTPQAVRF